MKKGVNRCTKVANGAIGRKKTPVHPSFQKKYRSLLYLAVEKIRQPLGFRFSDYFLTHYPFSKILPSTQDFL